MKSHVCFGLAAVLAMITFLSAGCSPTDLATLKQTLKSANTGCQGCLPGEGEYLEGEGESPEGETLEGESTPPEGESAEGESSEGEGTPWEGEEIPLEGELEEGEPVVLPDDLLSLSEVTFQMGRPYSDAGVNNEIPVHNVYLDAYQIGMFPVTNLEYALVLNYAYARGYLQDNMGGTYAGGEVYAYGKKLANTVDSSIASQIVFAAGVFSPRVREGYNGQNFSMADHPVVHVSWYGAVAYCNWLSEKLGLQPCYDTSTWNLMEPLRNGFRLPTEAEWEHAAAWDGSKHWRYAVTSDVLASNRANFRTDTAANPLELVDLPYTSPVGWYDGINPVRLSTPGTITMPGISPTGAYDMSGNVWEWCHDFYGTYSAGDQADPTGPENGTEKVLRGGSWNSFENDCRSASRTYSTPETTTYTDGFRIARTP